MSEPRQDAPGAAIWTVPNAISAFRIALVPVFIWALLGRRAGTALLVFTVAGLSDLLDGFLARVLHARSRLGMILDPAGDKLLLAAAYILLTMPSVAAPNAIPLGLTATVFGRDIMIVLGALAAYLAWGQTTFPPTLLGKLSTAFQVGTVFLVLLLNFLNRTNGILTWIFWATLALTVASGLDYVRWGVRFKRLRRRG